MADYGDPRPGAGESFVYQPSGDEPTSEQMTARYGSRREDGVWVTVCAWCKRIRSVAGEWQTLSQRSRTAIHAAPTHGICPDCAEKYVASASSARHT